jgi:head-tail adaptor
MIGRFKDRIEVLEPIISTDAGGGRTYTYATVATFWAKAEPLAVRNLADIANREQLGKVYRFTFLYDNASLAADMTKDYVIVWKGNRYKIVEAINVNERDKYITITASSQGGTEL